MADTPGAEYPYLDIVIRLKWRYGRNPKEMEKAVNYLPIVIFQCSRHRLEACIVGGGIVSCEETYIEPIR
jgi:hypothetical protein